MILSRCIYIVLPVHNRLEITKQFIRCIKKQTYTNFHLVLLDDGSTEDVGGMARAELGKNRLTVIIGTGNWWWGGALDYAFKWLGKQQLPKNDVVFICNNDVLFGEHLFQSAIDNMESGKFLFVKNIFLLDGEPNGMEDTGFVYNWKKLKLRAVPTNQANVISTRGLFSYVDTFLSTPGFYPNRYRHYLSDYAFTMLAHQQGIRFKGAKSMFLYVLAEQTKNQGLQYKVPFKEFHQQLFSGGYGPHDVPTMFRFIMHICRPKYLIPLALMRFFVYTIAKYVYFVGYKFRKQIVKP